MALTDEQQKAMDTLQSIFKREEKQRREDIDRLLKGEPVEEINNLHVSDVVPTHYCAWCGEPISEIETENGYVLFGHDNQDNDCPLDGQDDSTELRCEDEGKDGPPYSYQFIVYFDENMKDGYQKYCVQCGEPVGTCKHEKGVWFNDGPEIIRFGSTLIIPYIMEDKTFERVYAEYIGLTNSWRE